MRKLSDHNELRRIERLLHFERILWARGVRYVAGVDEVGLGALAGPVVAAAVVLSPELDMLSLRGMNDSKLLTPARRTALAARIRASAVDVGIGSVDVDDIRRLNIYQAGREAMRRAVSNLTVPVEHVLIDSRTIPDIAIPQNSFIQGDRINFSIAAASIVAKVYRDDLMCAWDTTYPAYRFGAHKGYGTERHWKALKRHGCSPIHRSSYEKLKNFKPSIAEKAKPLVDILS